MVNYLNAYLTVALFRFKSVKIKTKLIKNIDSNDFTALFTIANKGKQIYNISFLLQAYAEGEDGEISEIGQLEFSRKLINRNKSWRLSQNIIIGDLLYTFFRSQLNGSGDIKLQGVLEYLDNDTGNQILSVKDYSVNDFIARNIIIKSSDPKEKNISLNEFKQFVDSKYRLIDLSRARKIVENGDDSAIILLAGKSKGKSELTARLNFRAKEGSGTPHFAMALIENNFGEDWSIFYRMDYSLEYDICSTDSIHAVQLEIKSDYGGRLTKIIDVKISTSNEYKHHSMRLREISDDSLLWKSVKEICFTCFSNYLNNETGEFRIKDLKLKNSNNKSLSA
jgi:hypothetical protein